MEKIGRKVIRKALRESEGSLFKAEGNSQPPASVENATSFLWLKVVENHVCCVKA